MARIVVVGGGFGGVAAAVRLAKLRHEVVLLESGQQIGGRLRPRERDGFSWDRHPPTMTLPAVVRDLFRKSGRPLDRVLELEHLEPGRRHIFSDGTVLDLPMGSRGAQTDAVDAAIPGGGRVWTEWVDSGATTWEILRQQVLERPFHDRSHLTRAQWRTLDPRRSVRREARKEFRDKRLRSILLDDVRGAGQATRSTPAFTLTKHYVERNFGRWQIIGGPQVLADALDKRLSERRVDVRLGTRAHDLLLVDGEVRGVETDSGHVESDLVVWGAPTPPASMTPFQELPVIPSSVTHLGLTDRVHDLPVETVLHTNPVMTVHTGGTAPAGHEVWTIEHQGTGEDVLRDLARRGLDVRPFVVARVDLTPSEVIAESGTAAYGWQWQGWRTAMHRPGVIPRHRGLYLVGANAHPGASLELVGLGAAAVATEIGKA